MSVKQARETEPDARTWRRRALAEIRLRITCEARATGWESVARNLAQVIETEHGTGIASLRRQMLAHGLTEE